LPTVVQGATSAPAAAIGRKDLGTFSPARLAMRRFSRIEEGEFTYLDVLGVPLHGSKAAGIARHRAGRQMVASGLASASCATILRPSTRFACSG